MVSIIAHNSSMRFIVISMTNARTIVPRNNVIAAPNNVPSPAALPHAADVPLTTPPTAEPTILKSEITAV